MLSNEAPLNRWILVTQPAIVTFASEEESQALSAFYSRSLPGISMTIPVSHTTWWSLGENLLKLSNLQSHKRLNCALQCYGQPAVSPPPTSSPSTRWEWRPLEVSQGSEPCPECSSTCFASVTRTSLPLLGRHFISYPAPLVVFGPFSSPLYHPQRSESWPECFSTQIQILFIWKNNIHLLGSAWKYE